MSSRHVVAAVVVAVFVLAIVELGVASAEVSRGYQPHAGVASPAPAAGSGSAVSKPAPPIRQCAPVVCPGPAVFVRFGDAESLVEFGPYFFASIQEANEEEGLSVYVVEGAGAALAPAVRIAFYDHGAKRWIYDAQGSTGDAAFVTIAPFPYPTAASGR
jgi:hypothetical protein